MKHISFLVAVLVFAGCVQQRAEQESHTGDESAIVSSLSDIDVSSLVDQTGDPKTMGGETPEAVDISATSDVLMSIGTEGISNLADVDRYDKMNPYDKLSLSEAAMQISNLSEVDAGVKSIADVEVDATDIGSRESVLVSEVMSSVSNLSDQTGYAKTDLP
ncbi:MAG: hypothetical protein HKN43_01385 [Rhodothermales bacterium]|nr:hypothetical protein [Rhodothermales bacterium]